MRSLAIVGLQFGDEGKGKLTDTFAASYDIVIRYQGGNNAGHTVYANGQKYVLHLLPSGIIHPHTINVMGNGMVIDLEALENELQPFHLHQLRISNRAHLITPLHKHLDQLAESGKQVKIGTTLKGIGPAYQVKAGRVGIRMASLFNLERFKDELIQLNSLYDFAMDVEAYVKKLTPFIEKIRPYIVDVGMFLEQARAKGQSMLFEGAQGMMLDLDHGTYPFVTSSHPSPTSSSIDLGIPQGYIDRTLGVIKAYSTRVGEGPFPTEYENHVSQSIRERAHEYGATTGRPRRIGHLDLVMLKHAIRVSGVTELAVTLFDILSGVDPLRMATHYQLQHETISTVPAHADDFKHVRPVYQSFAPWKDDISSIRHVHDLPKEAKDYLSYLEQALEKPIRYISVGPQRDQLIEVKHD
jgi:adenylosuccinate synthase